MNVALVLIYKAFSQINHYRNKEAASESFTVFRKSIIECYTHMNLQ